MSTDRQRVKRAIQRIAVQAPELQSFLDDAERKGGKAKSAGVGSSSEAQGDRVCCDGSVGGANPGTGERDPDADGAGQDGLNGDNPADIDMGDGTLSGVTDCATGEPICFDGAGFIPPDGWDEPNEPPVDQDLLDEYEEGIYWRVHLVVSDTYICQSPTSSQTLRCFESTFDIDAETFPCTGSTGDICVTGGGFYENRRLQRVSCDGSTESYCNPTDADFTPDAWPEDSCVNLAIVGGKIVGSKFDPENDGSYSAPRDSIDLCSNGDQISLAPAADGGYKTINPTTDNGYLFNSNNERIAHIDGNQYSDPTI